MKKLLKYRFLVLAVLATCVFLSFLWFNRAVSEDRAMIIPPRRTPPPILYKSGGSKTAIVTYLAQEDTKDNYETYYLLAVRLMIRQLKQEVTTNGLDVDLIVMVLNSTCTTTRNVLMEEGVEIREVDSLSLLPLRKLNTDNRYKHQFGKLFMWSFVDYKEILYLDGDIFLNGNIAPLFQEIDREHFEIAGTLDFGFNFPDFIGIGGAHKPRPDYINGGFIWLKPSITRFNHMVSKLDTTDSWDEPWDLFEQHYINWYFGQTVQILDSKWNRQMLWWTSANEEWLRRQDKDIFKTTVGWHTKPWAMNLEFVTETWNDKIREFGLQEDLHRLQSIPNNK